MSVDGTVMLNRLVITNELSMLIDRINYIMYLCGRNFNFMFSWFKIFTIVNISCCPVRLSLIVCEVLVFTDKYSYIHRCLVRPKRYVGISDIGKRNRRISKVKYIVGYISVITKCAYASNEFRNRFSSIIRAYMRFSCNINRSLETFKIIFNFLTFLK